MNDKARVFFRRKSLHTLREYWLKRWDDLLLRQELSLNYTPKYHIESEYLDGFYLKLNRIEYLWYKGVFSRGIHLKSGRYYRDPYHLSSKGMGPRELVFPIKILDQLNELTLIGDWTRYQLCRLENIEEVDIVKPTRKAKERMQLAVDTVSMSKPPRVLSRWGEGKANPFETVCISGIALNGLYQRCRFRIPVREIHWNSLA